MFQVLYKFLILNRKVSIPGIGLFQIRRKPASLDFANKIFIAPSDQIAFFDSAADVDKNFSYFISREQQMEEEVALTSFSEFAKGLAKELETHGKLQLPGIGLLLKDKSGKHTFHPVEFRSSFFSNITAERTVRAVRETKAFAEKSYQNENATGTENIESSKVGKRDSWWLFAIILAGIAVAAIIFYYKQNGSFR